MLQNSNDFLMKRVKTALLFNDKYKQGYSYIMATTPISYSNLTPDQKIQYAKNVAMSNYGVTQPNTTAINTAKLDNLVNVIASDLQQFKQVSANIPPTQAIPLSLLPPSLQQYVSPPNVVPPSTLTLNDIYALETGVLSSLNQLKANPTTLPAAGASVSPQNVPPAAPTPTLATNTTPATVTASVTPAPALLRNTTPATVTAPAAPAPAVLRNTTPATVTAPAAPAPNLPRNTTPVPTTAPSTNPSSSILSNILTAATVVGGGAVVLNALNNRVQSSNTAVTTPPATATPLTVTAQQAINPNSDPNTNIVADAQSSTLQPQPNTNIDEFTGIDEQIQRQQQINDGTLEFAGIDEQIQRQQQINDLGEFAGVDEQVRLQQAIAINEEEQNLINEPLREPPPTTDGDEFTGIDEQVERQRQLEDGSLEFAGIDDQIALNENALQEPPQLSDEEVDAYLQQAGQQDETIESPNSITENVFDPSGNNGASVEENVFDPTGGNTVLGLGAKKLDTNSQATQQDVSNFQAKPDWRVRLSLAPGATYLYKDKAAAGILAPLAATDGVIFPYTPAISVQYAASYDATELTHSNYKFFTYRGSAVDSVSITCDFTAQDTFEANYLLAVIHFFRSVTKMFYGQDQNPKIGTPPPLCYLSGLGAFQFDAHPLAITSFNYTLPTDVDYIRAGATPTPAGVPRPKPTGGPVPISLQRMEPLQPGGGAAPAQFTTPPGSRDVTYVPTKMSISISAVPIVTRNDISNKFSLKEYGTGRLLRGTQRQGGGIW